MADTDKTLQTMIGNLEKNTGKSLVDWVMVSSRCGIDKHGALVKWLKSEHGLTHGYANLIAQETLHKVVSVAPQSDDVVAAQYAGDKAALQPIYESVIAFGQGLGDDVEIAPKKSYVALRRNKQFALIQPSTKTRVDLGLNLKGIDPEGELEASGSFSAMCTHRVRLESVKDFNARVKAWLKQAYGLA